MPLTSTSITEPDKGRCFLLLLESPSYALVTNNLSSFASKAQFVGLGTGTLNSSTILPFISNSITLKPPQIAIKILPSDEIQPPSGVKFEI